jgi:hypothetical protein
MKEERIITNKKGESICKKCNSQTVYSEKFDAYYCDQCNLWLEEKCIDPLCKLCKIRPIRPLKKKKPIKIKKAIRIKW